jgi:hypothetical protein
MKLDRHDAHYVDELLAAESSRQAILVEIKQAELDEPEKRRSFELFRTGLRLARLGRRRPSRRSCFGD